jgi:hypothetical protein
VALTRGWRPELRSARLVESAGIARAKPPKSNVLNLLSLWRDNMRMMRLSVWLVIGVILAVAIDRVSYDGRYATAATQIASKIVTHAR